MNLSVEFAQSVLVLRITDSVMFFCEKSHYVETLVVILKQQYRIYHIYSDRQAWANGIDPDEMLQNAASHLGLHCLPLIQQFLDTTSGSELYWFKF